jgi:hypothetical protein
VEFFAAGGDLSYSFIHHELRAKRRRVQHPFPVEQDVDEAVACASREIAETGRYWNIEIPQES